MLVILSKSTGGILKFFQIQAIEVKMQEFVLIHSQLTLLMSCHIGHILTFIIPLHI